MRRKFIAVIVFACMLLVAAGAIVFRHQKEMVHRNRCLSTLRSTGWALGLYSYDYNGRLPEKFCLMSNMWENPFVLVSPWDSRAFSKTHESWTNVTEWMDYFYIPWPSMTGAYTNFPLMYDRRLANHGGKGINILLVQQAVDPAVPPKPETYHGQYFWDQDAKWLRKFAREHPDLKIPMPEDIK